MNRSSRVRPQVLWLSVIITALIVGCGQTPSPSEAAVTGSLMDAGQWQTTLLDNFDGPSGAPPDPAIWAPEVGGTGWGNEELEYYTNGENTYLDGSGHLVIEARAGSGGHVCWYGPCLFTSGKLVTHSKFAQQYGRFEARIKMPAGAGLWPAFWLLGDNIDAVGYPTSGEIDVVESVGHNNNAITQHAHGPGLEYGGVFNLPAGQSVTDWHTYSIVWGANSLEWQVDGRTTRVLTRNEVRTGWVFDHPFYILLNLAVGGTSPGAPNSATVFPARMLVDYVRVDHLVNS